MSRLDGALRQRGVESIAVVNTPVERARLYFRFHPLPNIIAASDPERVSHRAFGLPNLVITENETDWPADPDISRLLLLGRGLVPREPPDGLRFCATPFVRFGR